jgi:hypothetical protein
LIKMRQKRHLEETEVAESLWWQKKWRVNDRIQQERLGGTWDLSVLTVMYCYIFKLFIMLTIQKKVHEVSRKYVVGKMRFVIWMWEWVVIKG